MIKVRSRSIGSLPKIGISFLKRKKPLVISRKTSLAAVDGQSVDENGRKEIYSMSHDLSSLNNFENVQGKRSNNHTDKDER